MKKLGIMISAAVLLFSQTTASAQDDDKKTLRDMAEETADALARQLNLDDAQIYRVDSTFMHDYTQMTIELEQLKRSKASNPELYMRVSDKWANTIDSTFQLLFTPEQWKKYMKTDFGREKRARDKRIAKRKKADEAAGN